MTENINKIFAPYEISMVSDVLPFHHMTMVRLRKTPSVALSKRLRTSLEKVRKSLISKK